MRVLFQGGPLDGQAFTIEDGRTTWEVSVWEQENLFYLPGEYPPKEPPSAQLVSYKISRVGGNVYGIDAIGVLA